MTLPILGASARLAASLGVLATLVLGQPARADAFQTSNPRFGATADVPSGWKADPPPENGDGQIFHSPDDAASIIVSGMLNLDETAANAMKEEAKPQDGEAVTYRQIGSRSVTLSGTKGGTIFYRRSLLVCRDQIWNRLSIEYPAARKSEFDALVARVARSLRFSGRSAQISACR